jgi:hypothetical protein
MLPRTALYTWIARSRHVSVAHGCARLAPRAIRERLRASTARRTRHTVATVKARPKRKAQVAVTLIVLGLRSARARLTHTAVTVLTRDTFDARAPRYVRLLARSACAAQATRVRDVHGAEVTAVRARSGAGDTRRLLTWRTVQALTTVGRVLTDAGVASGALGVGLVTSNTTNTR